jgi:hypothetical protein
MKTHLNALILAAGMLALSAGFANAATLFSLPGATSEFATPGAFDIAFNSTGGAGVVAFRIDGFNTLDGGGAGDHDEDHFFLILNGSQVFDGTWDLGGGGGANFTGPPGSTAVAPPSIFGQGGHVDISVPLAFLSGANQLRFEYRSEKPLGIVDEGWDVRALSVTGPGVDVTPPGVPEPGTWSLMVLGFLGLGGRLTGRRPPRPAATSRK